MKEKTGAVATVCRSAVSVTNACKPTFDTLNNAQSAIGLGQAIGRKSVVREIEMRVRNAHGKGRKRSHFFALPKHAAAKPADARMQNHDSHKLNFILRMILVMNRFRQIGEFFADFSVIISECR